MAMASSKCSVNGCKRDFDTLCAHCQSNVCTKHYIEHTKLANDELIPLADRLNTIMSSLKQSDSLSQAYAQLEEWREMSHRHIDKLCNEKKQQLQVEAEKQIEKYMTKLRELREKIKELIDEGDASFKQIEKIKQDVEECQEQCKIFEKVDYLRLQLSPIEISTTCTTMDFFTGGGTLLSHEHQIKLNEFYGKENQRWVLIYKATRDGFGSSDFHRCCDNQGPTITIIQSKNEGYLFGGYTSVSWVSQVCYVPDNNEPFIFTLTNPHGIPATKYLIQRPLCAIYGKDIQGPTFGGGHDICLCNNSNKATGSYTNFPHSYIDTTGRANATFTGERNFQTNDIEVYRLLNK